MTFLGLESTVPKGPHKGKKVSEIIGDKSAIFRLIKEGIEFDDDVLSTARIKKIVNEPQFSYNVGEHIMNDKKYAKDKTPLKSIIKELTTEEVFETSVKLDEDVSRETINATMMEEI